MPSRAASRSRSRHPGRMDGGASWISYSDMMAAMLLVFVLILCYSLYQYYKMLDEKEAALAHQQSMLTSQEALLTAQQATLADRENELRAAQIILTENELLLLDNQAKLEEQETALSLSQALLSAQQTRLDEASLLLSSQQQLLDDQQEKIDTLLGVRTRIIQDLSQSLSQENLRAAVDPKTGNIVVESTVFFDTGKSDIKESGKQLLNRFIPVYLNVLLRPEYSDYLGSIIVEGHTDTQGGYLMNLGLSQERALAVVTYCLTDMPGLNADQRAALERTVTPTGRSYSSPVYHPDGTVNMEQSRRVEFKFSLKDAEMIDEMNRILSR